MTAPIHPWFGREPALIINAIAALLSVGVGFALPGLTDSLAAAIIAVLTAGSAAWTAVHVKPVAPTLFTGLIGAAAALLAEFGLHATQQQVSYIAAAVSAVMILIVRNQVTPTHDPRPLTDIAAADSAASHRWPSEEPRRG